MGEGSKTLEGEVNSRDIIQRSMNYAVQNLLANQIDPKTVNSVIDLNGFLIDSTKNQCETACRLSARYLEINHKDSFDQVALIQGFNTNKIKHWESHVYMIAKDMQGNFFACSPANYDLASDIYNPLTTIMESLDLSELIEQIQELEGGHWGIDSLIPLWDQESLTIEPLRRSEGILKVKAKRDPMKEEFDPKNKSKTIQRIIDFFHQDQSV